MSVSPEGAGPATMWNSSWYEERYDGLKERHEKLKREYEDQGERMEERERKFNDFQHQYESLKNKYETVRMKAERLERVEEEQMKTSSENDSLKRRLDSVQTELDSKKKRCSQLSLENDKMSKQLQIFLDENSKLQAECSAVRRELNDHLQIHEYTEQRNKQLEEGLTNCEDGWKRHLDRLDREHKDEVHRIRARMLDSENSLRKKLQLAEEIQLRCQERIIELQKSVQIKDEDLRVQRALCGRAPVAADVSGLPQVANDSGNYTTVSSTQSPTGAEEDGGVAIPDEHRQRAAGTLDRTFSSLDSDFGNATSSDEVLYSSAGDESCLAYTPPPPYYCYSECNAINCSECAAKQQKTKWHFATSVSSSNGSTTAVEMERPPMSETVTSSGKSQSSPVVVLPGVPENRTPGSRWQDLFSSAFLARSGVVVLLLVGAAAFWTLRSHGIIYPPAKA